MGFKMTKNTKKIIGILIVVLIIIIGAVIVYKLITNREDSNLTNENINSTSVNTANNEPNEHSFFGKVIESHSSYIIVEPNENEAIRKSANEISIRLEENDDTIYEAGTNVKITYDGTVMESYPAEVKAIKIEVQSDENF